MKFGSIGIDSNILVYAELEPDSDKGRHAAEILSQWEFRFVVPVQSLLEFMHVIRRRRPEKLEEAIKTASVLTQMWGAAPTTDTAMTAATDLVRKHHLQVFDAVIICAVREAGGVWLLSEDMHDGGVYGGVEIVNPFATDLEGLKTRLLRA